jgi:hypothetical protein
VPELGLIEEFKDVAQGAFWRAGRDLRLGLRLPALHLKAGIGEPDGMDAGVRLGPLPALAPLYEAVYRSVLPSAIEFGLVTEDASKRWLDDFGRLSAEAADRTALWPPMIGTWKRKPGAE